MHSLARTMGHRDGVPSRCHATLLAATPSAHASMDVHLQQPFVLEQGVTSLGMGQPTNPEDRSTYVKFLVKVMCTDRAEFGIRYIDEPIEVDLEGAVGQLAGAVYNRAVQKWPDVRPASMFVRRGKHVLDMTDLRRSVQDVLPMAYNYELLTFRIFEVPHPEEAQA